MTAARALSGAGAVGALANRRNRVAAVASGLALPAGSLATRFGVFLVGKASAADLRETIAPQRARLDADDPTVHRQRRDAANSKAAGLRPGAAVRDRLRRSVGFTELASTSTRRDAGVIRRTRSAV